MSPLTTQIAVRLPSTLVRELDGLIAEGRDRSRASVIERALLRELRRRLAQRDLEILVHTRGDDDPDALDALAVWGQHHPVDD